MACKAFRERMFDPAYSIPIIEREQYAGSYHVIPVDTGHPLFHEPLVRLETVNVAFECYHARTDGANPPYCRPIEGSRPDVWSRKSVAEKLAEANESLRPLGVELFVLDGYRPIECQRGLWDFYCRLAGEELPQADERTHRAYTLEHIADPSSFHEHDPTSWPSHTTGAAVDVTLRSLVSGELLDMGSRFEEITDLSCNDHFERLLIRGLIEEDDVRLCNRRLLHWAMTGAGFANDPFVFWHYDWGNQLYIKVRRALFGDAPGAAWYGYITAPEAG